MLKLSIETKMRESRFILMIQMKKNIYGEKAQKMILKSIDVENENLSDAVGMPELRKETYGTNNTEILTIYNSSLEMVIHQVIYVNHTPNTNSYENIMENL